MKKLFVLFAVIMTSCTLSNEEKAERLVKETLKDYLYHPDSYEPRVTQKSKWVALFDFISSTSILL